MQKITFSVEYVKDGFHPLFENVVLTFDNFGETKHKDKECWRAFVSQHPELYHLIPKYNEWYVCGLIFTQIKEESL